MTRLLDLLLAIYDDLEYDQERDCFTLRVYSVDKLLEQALVEARELVAEGRGREAVRSLPEETQALGLYEE